MSDFWSGKRVLVTGATGLVGSWLTRALLDGGAEVIAFVRNADPQTEFYRAGLAARCTITHGSLETPGAVHSAINEHDVDTVFHLGAQTLVGPANRSPLQTFEANVRGTYLLLEACRELKGMVHRVLVASSDKAYGTADVLPYDETTPLRGEHPYDCSKSCTDLITRAYGVTYGLPVVTARCGNIYGGGDLNWSRIVPGTIRWLLRGERPVLRSDGTFVRDYVYVKDAVGAYLRMAEHADHPDVKGQAFNFGPGEPVNVLEIVEAIGRAVGIDGVEPEIRNSTSGEIRDQYLDSSRAHRTLGWHSEWSLDQGLRETAEWYSDYLGLPLLGPAIPAKVQA